MISKYFYIDAHAYHKSSHTQILVGIDTIAIHPWELKEPFNLSDFETRWSELKVNTANKLAIGECGLDRAQDNLVPIIMQMEILLKHFNLASELSLPIIIHSVRTSSDLLGMLKKIPFKNNILLHAFGGNAYEAQELLKFPVYFSYGARLLKNPLSIRSVPLDRILLETADQTEVSIEEIYDEASKFLNLSLQDLQERLRKNFLAFFNKSDDQGSTDFIKNLNSRHRLS